MPNGNDGIAQIYDWQNRTVNYQYTDYPTYRPDVNYPNPKSPELTEVSQIADSPNAAIPAYRFQYDYTIITAAESQSFPYLNKITAPQLASTLPNVATITYNGDGTVQQTQDSNGNLHKYDFSSELATVVTVCDKFNTQVSKYTASFIANMSETGYTDVNGTALSSMTYDANSADPYRPDTVTDAVGNPTHYTWDTYGNMLSATDARGATTTYHYEYNRFPLGQLMWVQTSTNNAALQTTTYHYTDTDNSSDTRGRLDYVDSPKPGTVAGSNPATVRTFYTYTALGNIATITAPGRDANTTVTTTFTYTAPGITEALGEPLTVTVSSNAANTLGETVSYTYDPRGTTHSTTDALNNETDFVYNLANQTTEVTYPKTVSTAAYGAVTHTEYAYLGGPSTAVTYFDESNTNPRTAVRKVVTTYGGDGEVLSVSGSVEPVSYTYDALFRPVTLTDGNSHVTHYYYNTRGYLDAVTLPGYGGATPLPNANGCYNVSGADSVRFQQTVSGVVTPAYNANGQVTQRIDGKGQITTYAYVDAASQLTAITYPGVTGRNVALTYDTNWGRLLTRTDAAGSYAWTYDDNGSPLTASTTYNDVAAGSGTLPTWTVGYGYNPDGSRAQMKLLKSGALQSAFTYGYDGVGRPSSLSNPYGQTFGWQYAPANATGPVNGWLYSQTAQSATATLYTTTYAYNNRGWLLDQKTVKGSTLLSEFGSATAAANALQYDATGNRTRLTANFGTGSAFTGTASYTYDDPANVAPTSKRGQLTAESNARVGGGGGSFAYDAAGNPTSFRSSSSIGYNANNQLSGTAFGYDGNGNPTAYPLGAGSTGNTFDPENRLTQQAITLSSTSSQTSTYGYKAGGLRAWKWVGPTVTRGGAATVKGGAGTNARGPILTPGLTYFLYDGGSIVAELDSSGSASAVNTWGAGGLLAQQKMGSGGSGSSVYTFDVQGNVAQRLDASGAVQGSYAFDAWGKRTTTDASPDPYCGYGGQWGYYTDSESGLTLCGHRYYDSNTGRWLTRDPIGYAGGINLYGYVGNNASNRTDPSGLLVKTSPLRRGRGIGWTSLDADPVLTAEILADIDGDDPVSHDGDTPSPQTQACPDPEPTSPTTNAPPEKEPCENWFHYSSNGNLTFLRRGTFVTTWDADDGRDIPEINRGLSRLTRDPSHINQVWKYTVCVPLSMLYGRHQSGVGFMYEECNTVRRHTRWATHAHSWQINNQSPTSPLCLEPKLKRIKPCL